MGLVAVLASLAASPSLAQAADPELTQAARAAYDNAVRAHERGDFAGAAREFAHADRLVPNDSVLKDALRETLRADSAVFGLMLVARAARSPNNTELQAVVAKANETFAGRAGRIAIECPESCSLEVDGRPLDPDAERWLAVGRHVVVLTTDSNPEYRDEHRIEVVPLETTRVRFAAPATSEVATTIPSTPPPSGTVSPRPAAGGISPAWFWGGLGMTLAFAGATTISGLDVSSRRQDFHDQKCSEVGSDTCDEHASAGRRAVTRTNVLLGATTAFAAATVATFFFVRWRPTLTTSVGTADGGMRLSLAGRF